MIYSIKDIVLAIKGNLIYWDEKKEISSFVDYNDQPKKNCLYFLSQYDDNEDALIEKLANEQIAGIVTKKLYEYHYDKWENAKIGIIEVKNITQAYLDAAKYHRNLFSIPFIEITGSSGKSTTKEMISCVLSQELNVLESYENFNAPKGVAYNLFLLNKKHEACILEAGMKDLGIIDLSSSIISPDIGIITCIQRAHLVSLGSLENIIKAKAEILSHIKSNGYLIINGDDENCLKLPLEQFKGQIYKFGFSDKNDIYATNIEYIDCKMTFVANFYGYKMNCEINTFGEYNIANALIAILVGLLLGISKENIVKGLKNFYPISSRQEIISGINYSKIINDNFNANPESTMQLINEIPKIAKNNPLVLIFGDIERPDDEIKDYAKLEHYKIGEKLAKIKFHYLICIGKWALFYQQACLANGIKPDKVIYYQSVTEATKKIYDLIPKNSLVIIKAQKAYIDLKPIIDEISI